MRETAADLACRLARNAEAVYREYLANGRREGSTWRVGDIGNTPERSLLVRLADGTGGVPGKWIEYVAPRVTLRICDCVLSHRGSTASTQLNASALRGVA